MNLPIIPMGNEEDLRKASKNGTKKNVPSLLHKGLKIFLMDDIIREEPSLHRDARYIGRRKAAGFFMYWLIGCRMYLLGRWAGSICLLLFVFTAWLRGPGVVL